MSYPPTEVGNISNDSLFSDSMEFDRAEKPEGAAAEEAAPTNGVHTPAPQACSMIHYEPEENSRSALQNASAEELEMETPPPTGAFMKPRRTALPAPKDWQPIALAVPKGDAEDEFDIGTAKRPVFHLAAGEGGAAKIKFQNSEPDMRGEVTNCFDEPGLLYRIVDRKAKTWAFYNDSLAFEVQVVCTFGKHSKIQALENTTMTRNEDGEFVATVTVYPCETEMFVKGFVNGFTSKLRAVPLSDEYFGSRSSAQDTTVIQKEMDAIRALIGNETDAEAILEVCLANNLPFVDLSFPPSQPSIDSGAAKPFKHLPWARPSMYINPALQDEVRLFRNEITPGSVSQGELGDCWLMCALATHAENPVAVMDMFRHPRGADFGRRERAVGAYRVTFNKNGLWRSVIVDDYLPVVASAPKFSRSVDPCELWPAILEKAFAKLHGSYAMIQSGDPVHALTDMTGCPSMRFDERFAEATSNSKAASALFDDWVRWCEEGYQTVVTTPGKAPAIVPGSNNTPDFSEEPELERALAGTGLLPGHAYTVLAARLVGGTAVVKLRNPWPHGDDWAGEWSRHSPLWEKYPTAAKALGCGKGAPEDNSVVCMSWADALQIFNGGGVTFTMDKANDYRVPITFLDCKPSLVFQLEVSKPMRLCLTLTNMDHRSIIGTTTGAAEVDPDNADYPPIMLSLCTPSKDEDDVYAVAMNTSADTLAPSDSKWTFLQAREISMFVDLEPKNSPYLLVPRLMESDTTLGDGVPQFEGAVNPIHFFNNYARSNPEDAGAAMERPEVPVVLGIRSEDPLDTDTNMAVIRCIEGSNPVFENFPKFPTDDVDDVEAMYFQSKEPGYGFADEKMGNALC